jgi:hypothetical protein
MLWLFTRERQMANRKRIRGMARVMVYISCVTAVTGFVSVRHARGEFRSQTLEFGKKMSEIAQTAHNELTTIIFNGQRVHVGSATTNSAPEEVLKRYEEYCKTNAAAPPLTSNDPKDKGLEKEGFQRIESPDGEDGAVVVCFVKGTNSKTDIKAAARSFAENGDLGSFGELRYAYVRKGAHGKTLVLTAWTESSFNLLKIAPPSPDSDVAGEDFAEVPRVGGSIRMLSARAEGTPYAANVYRTKESPDKVLGFYDEVMQKKGWFMFNPELTEEKHGVQARGYMKDGVVATTSTTVERDGTYVTIGLSGVSPGDKKAMGLVP